jgi:hypothetical protein
MNIISDLLTAIPFWFLTAFVFCVIACFRSKKHRKKFFTLAVIFGFVNLLLRDVHYTALFGSWPLRGVVVDSVTGKPIAGARVQAYWQSTPMAPIRMPAWVYWLPSLKCGVSSEPMFTDASGRFASYQWYGAKVWHGCESGYLAAQSVGYKYVSNGPGGVMLFFRISPLRETTIALDPDPTGLQSPPAQNSPRQSL